MALPLAGRRIVVTRSSEQAGSLVERLEARGATPVVLPLVRRETDPAEMDRLGDLDLDGYDWVVVTSPNGARQLLAAKASGLVARRIAAVGSTTAAALAAGGRRPDLVPERQGGLHLVEEMPAGEGKVLLVQAAGAAPTVAQGLADKGWTVDVVYAYRMVPVTPEPARRAEALAADALLLASGSAARSWAAAVGSATPPVVVAIGPQTADAARAVGLHVTVVADDHSLDGLVAALERALPPSTDH